METLQTFHGDKTIKENLLKSVKKQLTEDENGCIEVMWDSWDNVVNRRLNIDICDCMQYETVLGIPFYVGELAEIIAGNLSEIDANFFAISFLEAIEVGTDVSLVFSKVFLWTLNDDVYGVLSKIDLEDQREITIKVINLYERRISGDEPDKDEWKAIVADIVDLDVNRPVHGKESKYSLDYYRHVEIAAQYGDFFDQEYYIDPAFHYIQRADNAFISEYQNVNEWMDKRRSYYYALKDKFFEFLADSPEAQ